MQIMGEIRKKRFLRQRENLGEDSLNTEGMKVRGSTSSWDSRGEERGEEASGDGEVWEMVLGTFPVCRNITPAMLE